MKKTVISLILLAALGILGTKAEAVFRIVGSQVQCDTALSGCTYLPTTVTTLCTASCPGASGYSMVSSLVFWGSSGANCLRSVDGGVTWPTCATQPFPGGNAISINVTGAANGNVVAVARLQTPSNLCAFAVSTDNAATWTTVLSVTPYCDLAAYRGQHIYCFSGGSCEAVVSSGAGVRQIFRSSNNGVNWIQGETISTGFGSDSGSITNGAIGILPPATPTNTSTSFVSTSGDSYIESVAWSGTQGNCWGQVILNSVPYTVCQAVGAVPSSQYTLRTSTGAVFKSMSIPDADLSSTGTLGGVSVAPFANTMYLAALTISTAKIGLWVSQNSGSTFTQLASITSGAAISREGNAFYANGCVYFNIGSTPKFAKVC